MSNPLMICDNCSERVQLKFDIRDKKTRGIDRLKKMKCPYCKKLIYDIELRRELTNEKVWGDTTLNHNQA